MTVRASISRNEEQITFGKAWVHPGELSDILLEVCHARSVPDKTHIEIGWPKLTLRYGRRAQIS